MGSPFQGVAPQLRAMGYSVIPLQPQQKRPMLEAWSLYCTEHASEDTFSRWMGWRGANIGVCLGTASGLVALDLDNDVEGLHRQILEIVPNSPVKKRGAKGFTAFYRFDCQRSQQFSKSKVRVLDILSNGRQTVLPPSVHPDGSTYAWMGANTLLNTKPAELPLLRTEHLLEIEQLFIKERQVYVPVPRAFANPYVDSDLTEVEAALQYITADDYDLWVQIGMALKDKYGAAGFAIWDRWSASSHKYKAHESPAKWSSFRGAGITIASLFHYAYDAGFEASAYRLPNGQNDLPDVSFTINGKQAPAKQTQVIVDIARDIISKEENFERVAGGTVPRHLLDNAPGLPGRMAEYINKTSLYPQPVLALSASLVACGVLMAHRVKTETNLRTNLYALGLAPSGAGKDHARQVINNMFYTAGMANYVSGPPASGAGLLSSLRKNNGARLVMYDEFGRVLKNLSSKAAGTFQADIVNYMIELFSSAQHVFNGVEYANHDGKHDATSIDQPCLGIYAVTVPERYFESLTNSDAIDGFLARWLCFESKDYSIYEAEPTADPNEPPEALIAEMIAWKERPTNANARSRLDATMRISPAIVPYTDDARRIIKDFSYQMRQKTINESAARSGMSALYARTAEHAAKLALVAHEGDSITEPVIKWACELAEYLTYYMAASIGNHVASNELEKEGKRILRLIRDAIDWLPHQEIVRATQGMRASVRNELIANLEMIGAIEIKTENTITRKSTAYRAIKGVVPTSA